MIGKLNINSIETSEIYGPGKRLVIWFQGCLIHCKGCWNYEMWSFDDKILYSVDELLIEVKHNEKDIEGITILGGEPLNQSEILYEFLLKYKKIFPQLTIILYTGYNKSQFKEIDLKIIELCDILIANPYIEEKRNISLNLRGSENQILEFISNKYKQEDFYDGESKIEIKILPSGEMVILGYPTDEIMDFHD